MHYWMLKNARMIGEDDAVDVTAALLESQIEVLVSILSIVTVAVAERQKDLAIAVAD
jgi:hypothetical protein